MWKTDSLFLLVVSLIDNEWIQSDGRSPPPNSNLFWWTFPIRPQLCTKRFRYVLAVRYWTKQVRARKLSFSSETKRKLWLLILFPVWIEIELIIYLIWFHLESQCCFARVSLHSLTDWLTVPIALSPKPGEVVKKFSKIWLSVKYVLEFLVNRLATHKVN